MNKTCCSVDDALGFKEGVRGGGGVNDVRCGLQTKMMLFGGWWTKHVVRWMMHLVSKGGFGGVGGLMTFVVDCRQRWCCLVDDEQNMLFSRWCIWFQRGGSGGWSKALAKKRLAVVGFFAGKLAYELEVQLSARQLTGRQKKGERKGRRHCMGTKWLHWPSPFFDSLGGLFGLKPLRGDTKCTPVPWVSKRQKKGRFQQQRWCGRWLLISSISLE